MSFILDALKKSENERQQRGQTEFATVPSGRDSSRPPAWLWLLAVLLAINVVVLAGLLLRSPEDRLAAREPETQPVEAPVIEPAVEQRVSPPQSVESYREPAVAESPPPVVETPTQPIVQTPPPARVSTAELPDIDQLRAEGLLPLGDLRLDIHVFSDVPADRFVFINMVKHREGSTTSDGLTVDTITADGVVLEYRGRRFLLPRQ